MSYDIIGDIHGHALTLKALLERLGYTREDGVYRHPGRQVIFLGDFIDTGPGQRETIGIVRPMVQAGNALAVMGNHEFNAIAYATSWPDGTHLRPRNKSNKNQHAAFLAEYGVDSPDYQDVISWFKTLPLWLDLGDLRVIHACWDAEIISRLKLHRGAPRLDDTLLRHASTRGHEDYEAVEVLLKGKEIPLPSGHSYFDRNNKERHHIRTRWWDRQASTYRGKFLGNPEWATHIPDDDIEGDYGIEYGHTEPPVFMGHYWLTGKPAPLEKNVACLDYSVAKPGGKLVAYRWDGERQLRSDAFVWVERLEG